MGRTKILSRATRITDMAFEDFYDSISYEWQLRARRLQAKRWRRLKHQLL